MGEGRYSMCWVANSILVQTKVEMFVVSFLCDEAANIGVMDNLIDIIKSILTPLCEGVRSTIAEGST